MQQVNSHLSHARARIGISVVSHGHFDFVRALLSSLAECRDIEHFDVVVMITENTGTRWELEMQYKEAFEVVWKYNLSPRGFGSNHNSAFENLDCDFFFVVNPDVRLPVDFSMRGFVAALPGIGVLSPIIIDDRGREADFLREEVSILSLFRRIFGAKKKLTSERFDWFAGVFLAFPSTTYRQVGGFDERFFMYVEDCDLCRRIRLLGGDLVVSEQRVIHLEGRRTFKSFVHFRWHLTSLLRYIFFVKIFS